MIKIWYFLISWNIFWWTHVRTTSLNNWRRQKWSIEYNERFYRKREFCCLLFCPSTSLVFKSVQNVCWTFVSRWSRRTQSDQRPLHRKRVIFTWNSACWRCFLCFFYKWWVWFHVKIKKIIICRLGTATL